MPLFSPVFDSNEEYFDFSNRDKVLIPLSRSQDTGVLVATEDRVCDRKILEWSGYCGTYGQGGPGFFGLKLEKCEDFPEEWLILRIWSAGKWLNVNGVWLESNLDHYEKQKPLHSNYSGKKWDNFKPLVVGKKIDHFLVEKKEMEMKIGDTWIILEDDLSKRNVFDLKGNPKVLTEGEDLRDAWVIYPFPWINV